MGSGSSIPTTIPSTIKEAKAKGYTQDQIDKYLAAQSKSKASSFDIFFMLCKSSPRLITAVEAAQEAELSDEEREAKRVLRHKRLLAGAKAATARFALLSAEEREKPENQGDLELYSEDNLRIREKIRDDPKVRELLSRWWESSELYDDWDKNAALDKDEYLSFYTRLARLVDDDDEMSPEEIAAAAVEDFKADDDSGDGVLNQHEFKNAVFELADNWTCGLEVEEYVDFLQIGYDKVYGHLDRSDVLKFPPTLQPYANSGTTIVPMSRSTAIEFVVETYKLKVASDAGTTKHNSSKIPVTQAPLVPLADLCLEGIRTRYNVKHGKKLKKRMKTLALALEAGSAKETHSEWLWLFARLLGCHTISGRIRAIPSAGVTFICECFMELKPLLKATKAKLPNGIKSHVQLAVRSGKNQANVGFVSVRLVRAWLRKKVFPALGLIAKKDRLCHIAEDILRRRACTFGEATKARDQKAAMGIDVLVAELATVADVLVLVANLYCATKGADLFRNQNEALRDEAKAMAERGARM